MLWNSLTNERNKCSKSFSSTDKELSTGTVQYNSGQVEVAITRFPVTGFDFIFNRSRATKGYGNIVGMPVRARHIASLPGFIWIPARPNGLFARTTPAYPYFCSFHLAKMQSSESRRALFGPLAENEVGARRERLCGAERAGFESAFRNSDDRNRGKPGHLWSPENRSNALFRNCLRNIRKPNSLSKSRLCFSSIEIQKYFENK